MQAIAYTINGQPRLTWPAVTVDPETGAESSNIDKLIADLPLGTEYTLVNQEDADAWFEANQPQSVRDAARMAEITARLTAMDQESIRPLRAMAEGSATDYDRDKLAALEAEAAPLREELRVLTARGQGDA